MALFGHATRTYRGRPTNGEAKWCRTTTVRYYLPFFLRRRVPVSITVVRGFAFTVDSFTYRPDTALRPLFLFAIVETPGE